MVPSVSTTPPGPQLAVTSTDGSAVASGQVTRLSPRRSLQETIELIFSDSLNLASVEEHSTPCELWRS
jgi:hypothetical protein